MIETKRLKIYAASREQMAAFIASQSDELLKAAYTEMPESCLSHPDQWKWYAIRMIELKDGTHVGDLSERTFPQKSPPVVPPRPFPRGGFFHIRLRPVPALPEH